MPVIIEKKKIEPVVYIGSIQYGSIRTYWYTNTWYNSKIFGSKICWFFLCAIYKIWEYLDILAWKLIHHSWRLGFVQKFQRILSIFLVWFLGLKMSQYPSNGKWSNLRQFPTQAWIIKKQSEKKNCYILKNPWTNLLYFTKKCFYTRKHFLLYDQPRVGIIKNVLNSGSFYFLHFRKMFSILIL